MLTTMTEQDWTIVLQVFGASRSRRGDKGRDDRKFLEALHYFAVHNITWRALPAQFGHWNSVWKRFWRLSRAWCSDGFEISCWTGDLVRLAFIIDAHDREIIAWHALANAGISGSMVRDMMLEAVESRFAAIQAPHALEWLTDNGSVYTAHETRAFATALNLVPCFTPIQSPESNGISESFVKTFKRDYVRVNPLPDAIIALRQIAGWFLDYNENHPHSGLKMRSPREFMRAQSP